MSKDDFGSPIWIRTPKKEKFGDWIRKHKILLVSIAVPIIISIIATWWIQDYYYNLNNENMNEIQNETDPTLKESIYKELPLLVDIISLKNNEKLITGNSIILNGTSERVEEIYQLNLLNPGKDIIEDTIISITFEPENEFIGKMITSKKCSGDFCFSSEHPINVAAINPNEVITIQSIWNFSPIFLYEVNQNFQLKINITNQLYNQSLVETYPVKAILSRPIERWGASVELDQKVYTWTDKVYITIVDPGSNLDSEEYDVIGYHKENKKIRIYTESGNEIQYSVIESGYNTGIFTATLILTGFSELDANNDGIKNDASGFTFGRGPDGGFLGTSKDDVLYVDYQYTPIENVVAQALIRMNIADAQFDKSSYYVNEVARILVVDPDMNLDPEKIDKLGILVGSNSIPQGIRVILSETNISTGIFEGTISLIKENAIFTNQLIVSEGDEIWLDYLDATLPIPYPDSTLVRIEATSTIKNKN